MLLGVIVVATLIAGMILRRPSNKKGQAKRKGGKKKVYRDAKGTVVDGEGEIYQDDGLTALKEKDGAEYFDDSKF